MFITPFEAIGAVTDQCLVSFEKNLGYIFKVRVSKGKVSTTISIFDYQTGELLEKRFVEKGNTLQKLKVLIKDFLRDQMHSLG